MPELCCAAYEMSQRICCAFEARRATGGRRGAEHAADAVAQLVAVRDPAAATAASSARADVVAEHHGAQEVRAARAELLAERQRRRHDVAARMPRARQRVVGLVGMRHRAVGERRLDRAAHDGVADDRRHFLARRTRARTRSPPGPASSSDPDTIAAMVSSTCHFACSSTSSGSARSRA